MPGNYSRYFVEAPGNTILADHWEGEFNTVRNNFDPDGVDDASANLSAMQTTVDPGELGTESLATALRGEIQRLRFAIAESKFGTGTSRKWYESPAASFNPSAFIPIGSIIPHYDFNGGLTFDTSVWKYCDGSSATVGSLGAQTLPDLSNRYLVGFGTEAGGDIDTATWSATVVGNASHQVNLQHLHTISGSTASGTTGITASHSHTHAAGTFAAQVGITSLNRIALLDAGGTFTGNARWANGGIGNDTVADTGTQTVTVAGTSASPSSSSVTVNDSGHTHGTGTLVNANSLSTTQSVQPRSIRVRFIMRVS